MDNKAFSLDDEVASNGSQVNGGVGGDQYDQHQPSINESYLKSTVSLVSVSTTCSDENNYRMGYNEKTPINVSRPVCYTENFISIPKKCKNVNDADHLSTLDKLKRYSVNFLPNDKNRSCWGIAKSVIPILDWLPNYNVRRDLLADIITGFTVLALHIPQGLAYGKLAGVDPTHGLYVSLFPVLIYAIMGTSRQISIGK